MSAARVRDAAILLLVVGACVWCSGCLACVHSDTKVTGVRVSRSALDQVEPGETTKEWLLAALGPPTRQKVLPGGVEILEYQYTRKEEANVAIFCLLAVDHSDEKKEKVCFELRDGIVQKHWRVEE